MSDRHKEAMKEIEDSFRQFIRNGIWGTCVDCPRDSRLRAYPEFCNNKDRYDHLLSPENLFNMYNSYHFRRL